MLVSIFDKAEETENPDMFSPQILGGKGYGLWKMQQQGVNVPPALIIPTTVCVDYMQKPKTVMKSVAAEYSAMAAFFKDKMGYMPLLSVRSGAQVSMPGMMDTVLNVGLDASTLPYWKKTLGAEACQDSLERLHTMYGNVVMGLPRKSLEGKVHTAEDFEAVTGLPMPKAKQQVLGAIEAVFQSWNNDRAKFYRKMHNIPDTWGTAVVIQAMVFGNLNDQSCTGVMFSRNPDSGEPGVVGEFLVNAQGEDVVAGVRTPQNLSEMTAWNPKVADEVLTAATKLELSLKDVQDVEFTVQDGELYILQTRNAKRSARAAVKIAVDMESEGFITPEEAFKRVSVRELDLAQQDILDPAFETKEDFIGIPACSGVVTGIVVTSSELAINCKEPCILVTQETTPDDIAGMHAAAGVLTMTGGSTSHAAVVARGMNKPCVVGLSQNIELFKAGATVSIDGATGRVWLCEVPVVDGKANPSVAALKVLCWEVYNDGRVVPLVDVAKPEQVQALRISHRMTEPVETLVAEIVATAKTVPTLILDATELTNLEDRFYNTLFLSEYSNQLDRVLKALADTGQTSNIVVLGHPNTYGMTKLATSESLHELVEAESEILWVGEISPAVHKVFKWQTAEGVKFSALGIPAALGTSYVSESQVISGLLKC